MTKWHGHVVHMVAIVRMIEDRGSGSQGFLPNILSPTDIFHIFEIFHIFLRYGNFFIFTLISTFSFLISYFKLACLFEVLSKPVTSCSKLSLNFEGRGVPGHAAF